MKPDRFLTAIGAGISTFLLVTVLVIELLDVEFAAIVGLPIGLLAGVAASAALWTQLADLGRTAQHAAGAYATFGITVVLLLSFRYVNLGPSRDRLSMDVVAGVALAAATVAFVALRIRDRVRPDTGGRP